LRRALVLSFNRLAASIGLIVLCPPRQLSSLLKIKADL
jgi:hypothetical protein